MEISAEFLLQIIGELTVENKVLKAQIEQLSKKKNTQEDGG